MTFKDLLNVYFIIITFISILSDNKNNTIQITFDYDDLGTNILLYIFKPTSVNTSELFAGEFVNAVSDLIPNR